MAGWHQPHGLSVPEGPPQACAWRTRASSGPCWVGTSTGCLDSSQHSDGARPQGQQPGRARWSCGFPDSLCIPQSPVHDPLFTEHSH